jgi:hypothetical protein
MVQGQDSASSLYSGTLTTPCLDAWIRGKAIRRVKTCCRAGLAAPSGREREIGIVLVLGMAGVHHLPNDTMAAPDKRWFDGS